MLEGVLMGIYLICALPFAVGFIIGLIRLAIEALATEDWGMLFATVCLAVLYCWMALSLSNLGGAHG